MANFPCSLDSTSCLIEPTANTGPVSSAEEVKIAFISVSAIHLRAKGPGGMPGLRVQWLFSTLLAFYKECF